EHVAVMEAEVEQLGELLCLVAQAGQVVDAGRVLVDLVDHRALDHVAVDDVRVGPGGTTTRTGTGRPGTAPARSAACRVRTARPAEATPPGSHGAGCRPYPGRLGDLSG